MLAVARVLAMEKEKKVKGERQRMNAKKEGVLERREQRRGFDDNATDGRV